LFDTLGLDEKLLKALAKTGLVEPTPVQAAAIPVVLAGRDVQASARTGSGKSAAFMLPVLHLLLTKPAPRTATRCLVISPTRELAMQLDQQCRQLAQFTPITALVIVGGQSLKEQQARIRKNPEIIIGTPGRLLEHVQKHSLELGDLEFLVLDEADRILDMGFRDDVLAIVSKCQEDRQTLMLSATLNHGELKSISRAIQKKPEIINVDVQRSAHVDIRHEVILADDPGHKQQLCNWLLANDTYQQALVFTNTREHAGELAGFLIAQGNAAACLHGEMSQDDRKKVMRQFRDGKYRVLVATDLAARGLDIPAIDLVINYAMVRSGDDYVHRTGRTGRAGARGTAVSLVAPQEWNRMESVARYLKLEFVKRTIDGLPARFTGPAKKKKPQKDKKKKDSGKPGAKVKAKERHRNRRDVGKRRKPSGPAAPKSKEKKMDRKLGDGLAPLTKK
jgi:superfamily II DNA/RNA helicase